MSGETKIKSMGAIPHTGELGSACGRLMSFDWEGDDFYPGEAIRGIIRRDVVENNKRLKDALNKLYYEQTGS